MKILFIFFVIIACISLLFAGPKSKDKHPALSASQNCLKSVNAMDPESEVFQFQFEWPATIPVLCGGETIDYLLTIYFYSKVADHNKNRNFIRMNVNAPLIVFASKNDGESFVSTGMFQTFSVDKGLYNVFCNFQGSRGTHYIAHLICDSSGNVITAKSVCR